MDPTTAAIVGILSMASAKALETWGVFAFCLIVPGAILGLKIVSQSRLLTKRDEEIAQLRKERDESMTRRLEDAEKTLRLAQSGTATMAARSDTDQLMMEAFKRLSEDVAGLKDAHAKPQRHPSR